MENTVTKRPARDYQIACVDAATSCINTGYHDIYYGLPTGTGKTRIMTLLVELYMKAGRVLVIAHRKELIEQTAASIRDDIEGADVGIVMAEKNEVSADIIVGTWQSLTPLRLEHVLIDRPDFSPLEYGGTPKERFFSLILIDEAHHVVPGSAYERIIQQVRQHSPRVAVVGATATPFRSDKLSMQDVLPECAFTRSITEMQAAGWLAPLRWQAIKLSMDFSKIKQASVDGEADYNQDQLYETISSQTIEIVKKTAPHFNGRPAMVFAINVQHAHELAQAYSQAGICSMALSAQTNRTLRKDTLDAWKSGAIQCVVNVALFTEGFDYTPLLPNKNGLGVVVIAAPTQSPSRYLQMIGRGTRLKPSTGDFKDCLVFDVASNANLLETKQITLPRVMPTLQDDVFEKAENEFVDFDGEKEAELEKEATPKPPTQLKINDPMSVSWLPWGHNIMNDVYYASISFQDGMNQYAVIIPSQRKDGLYKAFILCQDKDRKWSKQAIVERAKPLGQIMKHINHVLASNGRKSFTHKDNPKRFESPSVAQMNFLKGKSPKYHQLAFVNRWNKGQVSSIITWIVLTPLVKKLIESERNAVSESTQAQASNVA